MVTQDRNHCQSTQALSRGCTDVLIHQAPDGKCCRGKEGGTLAMQSVVTSNCKIAGRLAKRNHCHTRGRVVVPNWGRSTTDGSHAINELASGLPLVKQSAPRNLPNHAASDLHRCTFLHNAFTSALFRTHSRHVLLATAPCPNLAKSTLNCSQQSVTNGRRFKIAAIL